VNALTEAETVTMGQIDIAVQYARKLEALLEERHGAQGKGLHEKVSSISDSLSEELVRQIRYIDLPGFFGPMISGKMALRQ
jgi:hypothetical protein